MKNSKPEEYTTEPVIESVDVPVEWISVETAGRVFSLGKTTIYELIKSREIRSVLLRKRGRVPGRRLIFIDSVRDYFARLLKEQEGGES